MEKTKFKLRWYHRFFRVLFWVIIFRSLIFSFHPDPKLNTFLRMLEIFKGARFERLNTIGFISFSLGTLLGAFFIYFIFYYLGYLRPKKKGYLNNFHIATAFLIVVVFLNSILPSIFLFVMASKQIDCEEPKVLINEQCCEPGEDFIFVCKEDEKKIYDQLVKVVKDEEVTEAAREIISNKLSVVVPPNYYAVRNIHGALRVPLYLMSSGDATDYLIVLIVPDDERIDFSESEEEILEGFMKGFQSAGEKKGIYFGSESGIEDLNPEIFENREQDIEGLRFSYDLEDSFLKILGAIIQSDGEVVCVFYFTASEQPSLFDDFLDSFRNLDKEFSVADDESYYQDLEEQKLRSAEFSDQEKELFVTIEDIEDTYFIEKSDDYMGTYSEEKYGKDWFLWNYEYDSLDFDDVTPLYINSNIDVLPTSIAAEKSFSGYVGAYQLFEGEEMAELEGFLELGDEIRSFSLSNEGEQAGHIIVVKQGNAVYGLTVIGLLMDAETLKDILEQKLKLLRELHF